MSGRSQDRVSNTKMLSSGARDAMWVTSCWVQLRALTTHATVDCGGAAGGRGMQGAAPVLSCHERQRRSSHPTTTLLRRLGVVDSRRIPRPRHPCPSGRPDATENGARPKRPRIW